MARTRTKLNVSQEVALADVTRLNRELREMKRVLEAEMRVELNRQLDQQQAVVDYAVKRAVELDVPRIRIYQDGLGTKNPYALNESLKRIGGTSQPLHMYGKSHPFFSWEDQSRGLVRVRYPNFPTTSPAEDYPEELQGMVVVEFSQVSVREDESDRETEFGTVPGFLRWEVERPASDGDDEHPHMANLLREWVERNR